jgi:hypothetical protein
VCTLSTRVDPRLPHENADRQHEQQQRKQRGAPEEEVVVPDVDHPREDVVAHDLRGAEIRQRVERDEQGSGRDTRFDLWQRHSAKRLPAGVIERASGLDDASVEGEQRGPRRQEDVRIRKQRQDEHRPEQPVYLGQFLHPERGEDALQHPARAERGDERERADVTGDDQRECRDNRPEPSEREVGLNGEKCQRDAHEYRGDRDPGGHHQGVRDDL